VAFRPFFYPFREVLRLSARRNALSALAPAIRQRLAKALDILACRPEKLHFVDA
jgi:hypothetical protein